MEDMAWVLYALLGTQVILIFLIWRIGAAVVGEIKSVHGTLVDVGGKLQDQTNELKAISKLLGDQTRYFLED